MKYIINDRLVIKEMKNEKCIFNCVTGKYIKLSSDAYNFICTFCKSGMSINEFSKTFSNLDEQKFSYTFFKELEENKIIINLSTKNYESLNDFKIYFSITDYCNLQCSHCSSSAKKITDAKFDEQKSLEIAEKIRILNPQNVIITGGEPLIHPAFKEIVKIIRKCDAKLSLMSNATLINDDNAKFISDNFETADISLDGVDENTTSLVRGKGIFEKTINGIKLLQKHGLKKIASSMVLTDVNINYADEFEKLCDSLQIKSVLRDLLIEGRARKNKDLIPIQIQSELNERDIDFIKKIKSNKMHESVCNAGFTTFQINDVGNVFPCQLFFEEKFSLGNILDEENVRQYFAEGKYRESKGYNEFYKYLPQNIDGCRECNMNIFCFNCPAKNKIYGEGFIKEKNCIHNKIKYACYFEE